MKRFRIALPIIALLTMFYSASGIGSPPEQRLYSEKRLSDARAALKEYAFRDATIGEAFAVTNDRVVAILLEIERDGSGIRQIKIFVNYREKRDLILLAVLDDRNNRDFRALVEKLKI